MRLLGCGFWRSWLPSAGATSSLVSGWIIWAMTGWFFLSCMVVVSAWMKAPGVFTNSWASASGLSSTMAMSNSPPSFLMRAGLPACICSRIATALSHIGSVPTLQWLAALVIQFAAGIARSTAFLVQPGMRWQAVWQLAWLRRPLPLGGCQCLAPRKRLCFLPNGMFRFRP